MVFIVELLKVGTYSKISVKVWLFFVLKIFVLQADDSELV